MLTATKSTPTPKPSVKAYNSNIQEGFDMAKPSVGAAVTAQEKEKKRVVQELTVLKADSKDSIFSLVFDETKNGSLMNNEH
jgi:hypothetical protein